MSNGSRSKQPVVVPNTYKLANGSTVSGGTVQIVPLSVSWNFPTRPSKPNPLSDTTGVLTRTFRNPGIYETATRKGSVEFVYNSFSLVTATVRNDSLVEKTMRALKAQAKMGSGDFNAAIAIAEVDKTAAMIRNRVNVLRECIRLAQQGRYALMLDVLIANQTSPLQRGKVPSRSLEWSSAFLEVQYGWRPLIHDVYGALESLQKGITTRGMKVRGSVGPRDPHQGGIWDSSLTSTKMDSAVMLGAPLVGRSSFSGRVSNPGLRSLTELGITNPALVAWELVPFSFVIDWFLPIGSILTAMTSQLGLSGVRGSVVSEVRSVSSRNGVVQQMIQQITREPWSIRSMVFPFTASGLSIERTANAIALLHQQGSFKKRS